MTRSEELAAIAAHIALHGVTKCPPPGDPSLLARDEARDVEIKSTMRKRSFAGKLKRANSYAATAEKKGPSKSILLAAEVERRKKERDARKLAILESYVAYPEMSLADIGATFNVTAARVQQIVAELAPDKLRRPGRR